MHRYWDGATWSSDELLGGDLAAGPSVTSWAANEMEVFAVFRDGQLYNIYWDGTAWHEWHEMGGDLLGRLQRPAQVRTG